MMAPAGTDLDRAALAREALVATVAERGFHGAAVSEVARRAGVAAGTIYVHYSSKDELVLAAYREVKRDLGAAAVAGLDLTASPRARFGQMWRQAHGHLASRPERARFLLQLEASPYALANHEAAASPDDPLLAAASAPDLVAELVDLPLVVLYELCFGPAVRLAAHQGEGIELDADGLARLEEACWRAVTR